MVGHSQAPLSNFSLTRNGGQETREIIKKEEGRLKAVKSLQFSHPFAPVIFVPAWWSHGRPMGAKHNPESCVTPPTSTVYSTESARDPANQPCRHHIITSRGSGIHRLRRASLYSAYSVAWLAYLIDCFFCQIRGTSCIFFTPPCVVQDGRPDEKESPGLRPWLTNAKDNVHFTCAGAIIHPDQYCVHSDTIWPFCLAETQKPPHRSL